MNFKKSHIHKHAKIKTCPLFEMGRESAVGMECKGPV